MADRAFNANIVLLGQSSVIAMRVENLASDPTGVDLFAGRMWINTTSHLFKGYDGSTVVTLGSTTGAVTSFTVDASSIENIGTATDPSIRVKALGITNAMLAGSIALSKLATDPLARANHTGTQLAVTISDFDTAVRTSRLDQMAAPAADVSMASHKLTNVTDPTSAQDAATKAYTDALVFGIDQKASVRAATTTAGTLASSFANGSAIDGITLATGDRILLKNQATGSENGIYTVNASGAPTRAVDADGNPEVTSGMFVFVEQGTVNGGTGWALTTANPITVGTTALTFTQMMGPGSVTGGTGITVTGMQVALTIPVVVTSGGTGSTTAAGARTNLGVPGLPYSADCTTSNPQTHTHNKGTTDVLVQVNEKTGSKRIIECEVDITDSNNIALAFSIAPTTGQYRVQVWG